jgi:hypothetical protein
MRKYRESEYRKYTNRYLHSTENIIQFNGDCQRRNRTRFDKNKGNRQNASATREILYRGD